MIDMIPKRVWRMILAGFALTFTTGVVVIVLLARGYADVPRDGLIALERSGTLTLPFTIETDQDRGFAVGCGGLPAIHFQVREDGYFSVTDQEEANWQGFIHIRSSGNSLYLHVNDAGAAVFRINEEIAWTGTIPTGSCTYEIIERG